MMTLILKERYGSTSVERHHAAEGSNIFTIRDEASRSGKPSTGSLLPRADLALRSIFLPQGYPESVSNDYLMYQLFDTIQAFASSITGTLATQALMKGVGVGDESATALAATMTWILKDGTGMVGRIMFAWLHGSGLDCDSKRWRLFADILNDFAICMEIGAPYFQWLFIPIVCTAGVFKSIVGVAGGATRAALTQHQARRNNMADVSAKDGSQETLVNLSALICSLIMVPIVNNRPALIWLLFAVFTALHVYANFRAVKAVVMESINLARMHLIVGDWLTLGSADPASVNIREPVLFKTNWSFSLHIGAEFTEVTNIYPLQTIQEIINVYAVENYLVVPDLKTRATFVILGHDATAADQLKACFQAEAIMWSLKLSDSSEVARQQGGDYFLSQMKSAVELGNVEQLVKVSYKFADSQFDPFVNMLNSNGWITSHVLFCTDEWRAEWTKQQ